MNKIAVVYASKYGSTKQYAQWIAEELSADLFESDKIPINELKEFDTIIYGGRLYAGTIKGINLIIKNFELIKNKNLIIFTCGLADPTHEENLKALNNNFKKIFKEDMITKIKFFHFRGNINYKKLTFTHKIMMSLLKFSINKKDPQTLTEENKEFLKTYGKEVVFANKLTIAPLIEFIKTY